MYPMQSTIPQVSLDFSAHSHHFPLRLMADHSVYHPGSPSVDRPGTTESCQTWRPRVPWGSVWATWTTSTTRAGWRGRRAAVSMGLSGELQLRKLELSPCSERVFSMVQFTLPSMVPSMLRGPGGKSSMSRTPSTPLLGISRS